MCYDHRIFKSQFSDALVYHHQAMHQQAHAREMRVRACAAEAKEAPLAALDHKNRAADPFAAAAAACVRSQTAHRYDMPAPALPISTWWRPRVSYQP